MCSNWISLGDKLEEEFAQFQKGQQLQSFHLKDLFKELEPMWVPSVIFPDLCNCSHFRETSRDAEWAKEFAHFSGPSADKTFLQQASLFNNSPQMASEWAKDYLKEVPELKDMAAANRLYGIHFWLSSLKLFQQMLNSVTLVTWYSLLDTFLRCLKRR